MHILYKKLLLLVQSNTVLWFFKEFVFLFCFSVQICIYTCIRCAISLSHKQEMFFSSKFFLLPESFLKSILWAALQLVPQIWFLLLQSYFWYYFWFSWKLCAVILSLVHIIISWFSKGLTMNAKLKILWTHSLHFLPNFYNFSPQKWHQFVYLWNCREWQRLCHWCAVETANSVRNLKSHCSTPRMHANANSALYTAWIAC